MLYTQKNTLHHTAFFVIFPVRNIVCWLRRRNLNYFEMRSYLAARFAEERYIRQLHFCFHLFLRNRLRITNLASPKAIVFFLLSERQFIVAFRYRMENKILLETRDFFVNSRFVSHPEGLYSTQISFDQIHRICEWWRGNPSLHTTSEQNYNVVLTSLQRPYNIVSTSAIPIPVKKLHFLKYKKMY